MPQVLLVEDDAAIRVALTRSLHEQGHAVSTTNTGMAALTAAVAQKPDVVLLDLGLPVMDGFEVAQRFRALPEWRGLEIVAITGYGQDIDRRRTRESGFDEHMVKPVRLDALEAWLRRSQRRRHGGKPQSERDQAEKR